MMPARVLTSHITSLPTWQSASVVHSHPSPVLTSSPLLLVSIIVALLVFSFAPSLLSSTPAVDDGHASTAENADAGDVPFYGGLPHVGSLSFFTDRDSWVQRCIRNSNGFFQFDVLKRRVIAVSGPQGRKAFFTTPNLNFTHGYRLLFGSAPQLRTINQQGENVGTGSLGWFSKKVMTLLRKDRIERILPRMIQDAQAVVDAFPHDSVVDPFEAVNKVLIQLSIRSLASHELASDENLSGQVLHHFKTLEENDDVLGIVFPWLPTWKKIMRLKAVASLWFLFKAIVEKRQAQRAVEAITHEQEKLAAKAAFTKNFEGTSSSGEESEGESIPTPASVIPHVLSRSSSEAMTTDERETHPQDHATAEALEVDALTHLLDDGAGVKDAVGFMLFSIYAGVVNTVNAQSWFLVHLAHSQRSDPGLLVALQAEIDEFVGKYASGLPDHVTGRRKIDHTLLQQIPLSIWESPSSLPLLDRCLKESIRMYLAGVLMRRNVGDDMEVPRGVAGPGGLWPAPSALKHNRSEKGSFLGFNAETGYSPASSRQGSFAAKVSLSLDTTNLPSTGGVNSSSNSPSVLYPPFLRNSPRSPSGLSSRPRSPNLSVCLSPESASGGPPPPPVKVPAGAFMAYPLSDIHYDPEVYQNPTKFDPSRYEPGREEDKKAYLAFLGWGAGRYACPGTRLAKLEMQIVSILLLSTFEPPELVQPANHASNRFVKFLSPSPSPLKPAQDWVPRLDLPKRQSDQIHVSPVDRNDSAWIRLRRRQ